MSNIPERTREQIFGVEKRDDKMLRLFLPSLSKINNIMPAAEGSRWCILLHCPEMRQRFPIYGPQDISKALDYFTDAPLHSDQNINIFTSPCLISYNDRLTFTQNGFPFEIRHPAFAAVSLELHPIDNKIKDGENWSKNETIAYAKSLGCSVITENVIIAESKKGQNSNTLCIHWIMEPTINKTSVMIKQKKMEDKFRWANVVPRELSSSYPLGGYNITYGIKDIPTTIVYCDENALFNESILE
jgi:hypothetical protein